MIRLYVDRRDRARLARRERVQRFALGLLIAAGLTALVAAGSSCGAPAQKARIEAASAALRALEVSAAALPALSEAHQMAMLEAAESEGRDPTVLKAQIREFRAKVVKIQHAIVLAADLVSLSMIDSNPASFLRAVEAVKTVVADLERLREP